MPEVVGSLPGGEVTSERPNAAAQAFRRRAQTCLELAERQVRRVLGRTAKRGAARFNRLTNASRFVRRKIVDHDDILAFERGGQTLWT